MKRLVLFLILLCLTFPVQAQSYLTARVTGGTTYHIVLPGVLVTDTLKGLTALTLTYEAIPEATFFTIAIVPDSIGATKTPATDSLTCGYRGIPRLNQANTTVGSARYPMLWRTSTGDTATVLNWTPGALYFVSEVVLDKSPYHQFTFTGSAGDTIPVRIYFIQ